MHVHVGAGTRVAIKHPPVKVVLGCRRNIEVACRLGNIVAETHHGLAGEDAASHCGDAPETVSIRSQRDRECHGLCLCYDASVMQAITARKILPHNGLQQSRHSLTFKMTVEGNVHGDILTLRPELGNDACTR